MPQASVAARPPVLQEVRALRGFGVEWAEPQRLLVSRRNRLFDGHSADGPFREIGVVPAPGWRAAAGRVRPLQRLLRHMVYNAVPLADGTCFVTFDRSIGVLGPDGYLPIGGRATPSRVLRGACATGSDGAIYFGAYLRNPERREVHVYRYAPGEKSVDVVHTFPAGSIRHVHGVYADPHDGALWITTGDRENECRVLRTTDLFGTLDQVGGGDETWRCVSLQFTREGVVYGTDAEFRQNWLYMIDRSMGERRELQAVEGPVYYSAAAGNMHYFSVAAELCPSQVGRFAALWQVGPGGECARIAGFAKDRLPILFLAGTLDFPAGPGLADQLLFRCTAVARDNTVMKLSL